MNEQLYKVLCEGWYRNEPGAKFALADFMMENGWDVLQYFNVYYWDIENQIAKLSRGPYWLPQEAEYACWLDREYFGLGSYVEMEYLLLEQVMES